MAVNRYTVPTQGTPQYKADNFSVFDIYSMVFGYRAIPFPTEKIPQKNLSETMSKIGVSLFKRDANGREAFCPITLEYNGKSYDLPYSTIAIQLRKKIIDTPLINRRGSVKELIQIEDYKFTINGVYLSDSDFPEDELTELDELFNINEPVKIKNAFVEIFLKQDNSVVIESCDLPDMKGVTGAQAYSFSIVSDTILELEIK
jgi:hypothetical protein